MTDQEFINLILLSIDSEQTATTETELDELDNWYSLASMIVLGLLADHFDKHITAEHIRKCTTFQDVLNLRI